MVNGKIFVVKKNGEREEFSEEKVLRSMSRIGLPESLLPEVLTHIKQKLHENISTEEIFRHIIEFLQPRDAKSSLRYNLKQALFELGPTGFPFERYMQRVFQQSGYAVEVDLVMRGDCITHEIDLLIEKNGRREALEAKFHNQQGVKTESHVALYTYARFLDIKEHNQIDGTGIVTNTKLSQDAAIYAACKKMRVIAWNYPEVGSLQDFVEQPSLYPITILPVLSTREKQLLLENNIILCSDLASANISEIAGKTLIPEDKLKIAQASAEMVSAHSAIKSTPESITAAPSSLS